MDYFREMPRGDANFIGSCLPVAASDPGFEYPIHYTQEDIFWLLHKAKTWNFNLNVSWSNPGPPSAGETMNCSGLISRVLEPVQASRLSCNGPQQVALGSLSGLTASQEVTSFMVFDFLTFENRMMLSSDGQTFYAKSNMILDPLISNIRIWIRNFAGGGDDPLTGFNFTLELGTRVVSIPCRWLDSGAPSAGWSATGSISATIASTY